MMGYFMIGGKAKAIDAKKQIRRLVLLRSFFIFLIAAAVFAAFSPTFITGAILVLLGFVYAVYHILMLSLTMELVPAGKNGIFDVLVGVGAATGSFAGPYLASLYGFLPQFLVAAAIIFLAFLILKISSSG
jgi:predicted MFS family arabinose efflux permease